MQRMNIGKEKAVQKIRQYCAYQERSHLEAKEKLYTFGLYKAEVEEILSGLIEDNYLNEERFAIMYAGGKFRIKNWGKIRIKYELKQKRVSDYCIKKALAEIDMVAYEKTLYKLCGDKWDALKKEKNQSIRKNKLQQYLISKGYENDLVRTAISSIDKK